MNGTSGKLPDYFERSSVVTEHFLCSDLRASLSGKDIPEDIKARLLRMHEDNVQLQEQLKTAQEKLVKARSVCAVTRRDLFPMSNLAYSSSNSKTNYSRRNRPRRASRQSVPDVLSIWKSFTDPHNQDAFEEAEGSYRSQIKILEEDVARHKVILVVGVYRSMLMFLSWQRLMADMTTRYRREQTLMLSIIHGMGMKSARDHLGGQPQQVRAGPTAWLGQQRKNVSNRSCRIVVNCADNCVAAWTGSSKMMRDLIPTTVPSFQIQYYC